jgi:PEP-CTERM motif
MMKHLLAAACAAGTLVCAHAQTVSSTLFGVSILGNTYDVTFVQSVNAATSFNMVFGSGSPTLAFDAATASDAATQLLAATAAAGFDITPATDDPATVVFILPYAHTATQFSYYAGWAATAGNTFAGISGPFVNRSRSTARLASFATFTPSVPEPSTALLAVLGGGALLWVARRKVAADAAAGGTR